MRLAVLTPHFCGGRNDRLALALGLAEDLRYDAAERRRTTPDDAGSSTTRVPDGSATLAEDDPIEIRRMRGPNTMRRWIPFVLVVSAALAGCGGPLRYQTQGMASATGADAFIEADVDTNGALTRLKIKIENLPPPERIEAGSTGFVVWARANDGTPWRRIGALKYDPDKRVGELLEASVPETRFQLVVSAEKMAAPEAPSATMVVRQAVAK